MYLDCLTRTGSMTEGASFFMSNRILVTPEQLEQVSAQFAQSGQLSSDMVERVKGGRVPMNDRQRKFKYIMTVIGIVGVLGTVVPNLLNAEYAAAEKAVICISYLVGVPLVVSLVYWAGKNIMKG
ncbi:hypothetical protein M2277_001187 [Paenibacillus sp. LBL]|nr:hypothetical protein [Paenibacillus sp. LBL]